MKTIGVTALAPILWGTTYLVVSELLPSGRPLLTAAVRVIPAGIALLVAGALRSRWRPRGAEWRQHARLALFNFALFFPLLIVAVHRLPGGVAAAAGGVQPLLVATFSWVAGGPRPRRAEVVAGIVAALGVAMVVIRPGADLDALGVAAALAANVSFAVGVVLTKRSAVPPNRLAATGWQLLMSGLVLVPLAVVLEGPPPAFDASNLAGAAYLSLVATALAFVVWFSGVQRLPRSAPPLLGLAAPVTGAILGWAVIGQSLSAVQVAGFAVTLGAIASGTTVAARTASPAADVVAADVVAADVVAADVVATDAMALVGWRLTDAYGTRGDVAHR